jgi:hypothetical protein
MKLLATLLTLTILPPAAANAGSEPLLFCNITESLGSSYQPAPEDGSGESHYKVTKTRVWYFKDLQKGIEVESDTVAGFRTKLRMYDATTWDENRNDVNLFGLEGTVKDLQTGAVTTTNNLFTKKGTELVPGLGSFLTIRRANRDRIEIACANRH